MVGAMLSELELRKNYLPGKYIDTIYFGGGTPSSLDKDDIAAIIRKIRSLFDVSDTCEITLEANPDDLDDKKLQQLAAIGINRLSIGIQSFFDDDLSALNRTHSSGQADKSVQMAKDAGFENITVDLIFGLPGMSTDRWKKNVERFIELGVPHLSAYNLTIEHGTHLHYLTKTSKVHPANDDDANEQFLYLREQMIRSGYDHYEISNYALPGYLSRHNSSYWLGKPYLGIGPSAHSYDLESRQWNVASNMKYMAALKQKNPFFEREELSVSDRYNEYILTRLRTKWGIDTNQILSNFGEKYQNFLISNISSLLSRNLLTKKHNSYILTEKGLLLADKISSILFLIE